MRPAFHKPDGPEPRQQQNDHHRSAEKLKGMLKRLFELASLDRSLREGVELRIQNTRTHTDPARSAGAPTQRGGRQNVKAACKNMTPPLAKYFTESMGTRPAPSFPVH
jgi:hypothetical protein